MNIKARLLQIGELIDQALKDLENEHIQNYYTVYINVKKDTSSRISNISTSMRSNYDVILSLGNSREVTIDTRKFWEDMYRKVLDGKKYGDVHVYTKPLKVSRKSVDMETFIMITNPDFPGKDIPVPVISVNSTSISSKSRRFVPNSWENCLYAGSCIPYEDLIFLLERITDLDGFHFRGSEYTKEEWEDITQLLNNFKVKNPIWTR